MRTPTCPVCGAKFSMDPARMICKKCGAPDELLLLGKHEIKLYRMGLQLEQRGELGKRARKRALHAGISSKPRRRKHGGQVRVA